jgi:hypothetical protein
MTKYTQLLIVALNMAVLGAGYATNPKSSILNNSLSGLALAVNHMESGSQNLVTYHLQQTSVQEHLPTVASDAESPESNDSCVKIMADIIAKDRAYRSMCDILFGKK